MTEVEIRPGLRLCAAPALFIESLRALVVADVHWGYAASQRAAGRLMPAWGDDEIDARLRTLLDHYAPRTLIVAGDIVHASAGSDAARSGLARLPADLQVVCVGGNHDRRAAYRSCVDAYQEDGYVVHHGDKAVDIPPDALEIVGHHHPAATWFDGAGTALKFPALVEGPRRIILPAFSPWAAGVAWNHRLEAGERLWLISPRRIFPIAERGARGKG